MNLSSDAPMEDEPVKKAVPNSITIASLLSPFLGYIQPQACPKFGGLLRNACSFHKWTPRAWPLEPRRKLEIVLVPQSEWYVQLCEDTGTTVGIIIVSFEEYDSTVLAVESKNLYSVIKKWSAPGAGGSQTQKECRPSEEGKVGDWQDSHPFRVRYNTPLP